MGTRRWIIVTGIIVVFPAPLLVGFWWGFFFAHPYGNASDALEEGDVMRFEMAVRARPELVTPDDVNLAIDAGHDYFSTLYRAGLDLSVATWQGATPLSAAARSGNSLATRLLVERGLCPNRLEPAGWTALHSAAVMGRWRVVDILAAAGGNISATSREGWTPLHVAPQSRIGGGTKTTCALLDAGADMMDTDADGRTALHAAVASEHASWDLVHLLLLRGGYPLARDTYGETPLSLARHEADRLAQTEAPDRMRQLRNARVLLVLEAAAGLEKAGTEKHPAAEAPDPNADSTGGRPDEE